MRGDIAGCEYGMEASRDIGNNQYKMSEVLAKHGVKAICYCTGKWGAPGSAEGDREWQWDYHCSPEYALELGAVATPQR